MPCWTRKDRWTEAARPICVFHLGHASMVWEARCVKAALCQHARAVYSALRAFPMLPKQLFISTFCFVFLVFFSGPSSLVPWPWWNPIPQQEWSGASTAAAGPMASAGTTLLPWTPARSCGHTRGFPNVGLAVGLLPWWRSKKQTRGLPGFCSIWVNGTVVINIAVQRPNAGVAVVWSRCLTAVRRAQGRRGIGC